MDRLLVLVRHGQSEWNLKNLFTGWKDPDLTEQGVAEAHAAGKKLKAKGFHFDIAYTSALTRAQHTLKIMLEELGQTGLHTVKDKALNQAYRARYSATCHRQYSLGVPFTERFFDLALPAEDNHPAGFVGLIYWAIYRKGLGGLTPLPPVASKAPSAKGKSAVPAE